MSTRKRNHSLAPAFGIVYLGYATRYLSLIVLIPLYTRLLGASEYGSLLSAMSLYTTVWATVNFGFSPVGSRSLASASSPNAEREEILLQMAGRQALVIAGIVIGLVATATSPILRVAPYLGILATSTGIVAAFNLGWYFQGKRRFSTSIGVEMMSLVSHLLLVTGLLMVFPSATTVMVSLLLSQSIATFAAYKFAGFSPTTISTQFFSNARKSIKIATPVFLFGSLSNMVTQASSLALGFVMSADKVGHFGSAERLTTVLVALFTPASQVLVSEVSHRLNSGEGNQSGKRLSRISFILALTIGSLIGALGFLLAPFVIPLIFGPEFTSSIQVFRVLCVGLPITVSNIAITMIVLVPNRQERIATIPVIASTVIGFSLVILLAKIHGPIGAAFGKLIGDGTGLILLSFNYLMLRKRCNSANQDK